MSKAPFDWMDPRRNPDRDKIEKARREAMYRSELEDRAALLQRLGYAKDKARARLAANLAWDFPDGKTPLDAARAGRDRRPTVQWDIRNIGDVRRTPCPPR